MQNITKKLLAGVIAICLSVPCFGALSPSNPPISFTAFGTTTSAAVSATLQVAGADGYNILLDGSALATSTITVAIEILDAANGVYVAPTTVNGVANPITFTNGTSLLINVPGGVPGIRVNVTSFGTATGTFRSAIYAY
jgi:hypothetical protein